MEEVLKLYLMKYYFNQSRILLKSPEWCNQRMAATISELENKHKSHLAEILLS